MNEEQPELTKKERQELRRREKKTSQELQRKNKILKKYFVWIISFIVIGGGLYGLVLIAQKSEDSRPGQVIPIQGEEHISENSPLPEYNSNPPTSGPHAGPVRGGFYSSEIKDINAVHNLEHGFIWITYKNVDEETIGKLEKIGQQFTGSVIISLREVNDSNIAIASWGRLEKMDVFDEEFAINFIKKNKNKSPEQLAR